MKKALSFLLFVLSVFSLSAQDTTSMLVGVRMPEKSPLPQEAQLDLRQKLYQLTTLNEVGSEDPAAPFVIEPHVSIKTSEPTTSIPRQVLVKLSVTLLIADRYDSQQLASQTEIACTGVGKTESEAMRNAIQQIDVRSASLKRFMDIGKKSIAQRQPKVEKIEKVEEKVAE